MAQAPGKTPLWMDLLNTQQGCLMSKSQQQKSKRAMMKAHAQAAVTEIAGSQLAACATHSAISCCCALKEDEATAGRDVDTWPVACTRSWNGVVLARSRKHWYW
jgi:hypothetical protein